MRRPSEFKGSSGGSSSGLAALGGNTGGTAVSTISKPTERSLRLNKNKTWAACFTVRTVRVYSVLHVT